MSIPRRTILALAAAASPLAAALAQGQLPRLERKANYRVGFSQTESNNPWRIAQTESMRSEAQKRGDQLVYTDAASSAAKQVSDVNSMIAQRVDLIFLRRGRNGRWCPR
jgi:ribose transport system substrate-binding protein